MSNRLPTPGGDDGTWGEILNTYLAVSLASDGTLNSDVVGTSQIQANAVTNTQLDVPTQTAIAAVSSKYVKPVGGIPATDLAAAVQTSLGSADSAVQTVNGKVGSSVSLAASDVAAIPTSQLGAASGVATLDGSSQLTASQIPGSVVSGSRATAKGDILAASGVGAFGIINIGANGTVLTVDSTQTEGLRWAAPGNLVVSALANVTGTVNLDASLASVWTATLTGATTFNFINVPSGQLFAPQIIATQNGTGGYTVSFSNNSSVITPQWDTGVAMTANTTAGATTIFNLETPDGGSNWYGQGQI